MTTHLIDIHKAAECLGVKDKTLYGWVHERKIPFCKIGRLVRFDPHDLEKWVEGNKVPVGKKIDENAR